MLKKTFFSLFCFFTALTILSFTQRDQKPIKTIIIDPGHGGYDQGAPGLISTEAQISLALSLKLGDKIAKEMPDVKALFTRATDIIPGNSRDKNEGLRYRADFANKSRADLFISIHCNAAGKAPGGWNERRIVGYDEKISYRGTGKKKRKIVTKIPIYETFWVHNHAKGTETFIWTAKESAHKGKMVGDHSEFASYADDSSIIMPENDPVINAMKLVYTKKYFLKSLKLAELVQHEFENTGRINRGVKQRNDIGIWVLHATGMPSILVEAGFITNKEEEEYMNSSEGQEEIVNSISNAVKKYLDGLDVPRKGNDAEVVNDGTSAILQNNRKQIFKKPVVLI
ncbi:MAG: N-acetylmuramoyl-L-alanine amidase [Flavisolibacter sp.]|jgi:N-acetylmuramoyl-L-alanine amidase|nr:N-acetylmuramoyl-L-alanine amidase [Flavisolibacter sp.]